VGYNAVTDTTKNWLFVKPNGNICHQYSDQCTIKGSTAAQLKTYYLLKEKGHQTRRSLLTLTTGFNSQKYKKE